MRRCSAADIFKYCYSVGEAQKSSSELQSSCKQSSKKLCRNQPGRAAVYFYRCHLSSLDLSPGAMANDGRKITRENEKQANFFLHLILIVNKIATALFGGNRLEVSITKRICLPD